MNALKLAWASIFNRRVTSLLTVLSIALSVCLLMAVERVRHGAKDSFQNTISQTDLIVGAKGGTIQLLLYSVFRMGSATDNVSYETYEEWKNNDSVKWTIPYSLGDSHRGFRVVGTDENFYKHYRFQGDHRVTFQSGIPAQGIFDVVLGATVAERFDYKMNQNIVLSHGVAEQSLQHHDDKPFKVVGILEKTGTPIDRSLYITLQGLEAIHIDWQDGAPPMPGDEVSAEEVAQKSLEIKQITAFLLRTNSRFETLGLQRDINDYDEEAIMAIIPGVALSELWEGISFAENALRMVTVFVVIVGLLGMLVSLYNSLNERRREMAILRSIGAGPRLILLLLLTEAGLLCVSGVIAGVLAMFAILGAFQARIAQEFGLYLEIGALTTAEWLYALAVLGLGLLMGVIPALRAYFNTLHDGLTPQL